MFFYPNYYNIVIPYNNNIEYQKVIDQQPSKITEISVRGINFIKRKEGLYLTAYICPGGRTTIGWGSTFYENGKPIRLGDRISVERAEVLLNHELKLIQVALNSYNLELNQNQYDALISFIFNVGISSFRRSTLLKHLQLKDYDSASKEFIKWNKVVRRGKKVPLKGLTIRRQEETNIFLGKDYD